jgi:N-methylhydantoinase B/oxoprolinase/acetone carboxylase alpha subunit
VRDHTPQRTLAVPYSRGYWIDDGTIIALKVDIDDTDGTATFDFTGTSPESLSNLNAPESVTRSALIYCLRTLIGTDMPLNAGAAGHPAGYDPEPVDGGCGVLW